MGNTERILSYLPPAFKPYPRPSLLYLVADAVGQRLSEADNLLAATLRAHWVDLADQGTTTIRDLRYLAALYDLLPRDDEDVEAFRLHLKSYVRIYMQGASTVRGVLKLAASTLALSLEDDLEPQSGDLPYIVETQHPGDDATFKLFGFRSAEAHGTPPAPARVVGTRDLTHGVDLSAGRTLLIAIDHDNVAAIDVAGDDPQATDLWEVARKINQKLGGAVATHDSHTLHLSSGVPGPDGEIQVGPTSGDAADVVLGIAPRAYQGADAQPAQVRGTIDHAPLGGIPTVDLKDVHYVRFTLDGGALTEVDVRGADEASTTLDEVCDLFNAAAGATVASHDGHYLTLASPTPGPDGQLEIVPAPANDAQWLLFGSTAPRFSRGVAAAPATLAGRADLSLGIDLSKRHILRLSLDGGEAQEIDCAGPEPTATTLFDLVERLNGAFSVPLASSDGRHLILTSPDAGAGHSLDVHTPLDPVTDATDLILGVAPRSYVGLPSDSATVTGLIDLTGPIDLRLQRRLWLSLDGVPVVIDCAGADPEHTQPQEIVDAINRAAKTTIAFHQNNRLLLQSPTSGAQSALVLRAPEKTLRKYFYTRGRVREDAATALFGFASGRAQGREPEPARLIGTVDLRRGADLRVAHSLRLRVDDLEPLDIRVADPARPLVTLLPYVIQSINTATKAYIASEREGKLELISPTAGPQGRIAFETCTASDAGSTLLGLPSNSAAQGRDATTVRFIGLTDVSPGLLVDETYRLQIGVDGQATVDIDLRTALGPDVPPIVTPAQIVAVINQALGGSFAETDEQHIILTSKLSGTASTLTISPAPDHDATPAVLGVSDVRRYTGQEAAVARLNGLVDLSQPMDLSTRRHLSLEIDGQLLADIDGCKLDEKLRTPVPTSLADIIAAIDAAAAPVFKTSVAGQQDGRLFIKSPTSGSGSSVVLRQSGAADARQKLLGDAPLSTLGVPGIAAVLSGTAKLTRPVDLSQRALISLRVDGGEAHVIDCTGEEARRTFSDEVVTRINAVYDGLAAIDAQRHLILTATHSVELLTQRNFTLFEYPPVDTRTPDQPIFQRQSWSVVNDSVRAEPFEWILTSLHGVDRPRLTNADTRAWVQISDVISAGFVLHVRVTEEGQLQAWAASPTRGRRELSDRVETKRGRNHQPLPVADVLLLPGGESHWQYSDCYGDRFNQTTFGGRPHAYESVTIKGGHFAGGPVCKSPGLFNVSSFFDETRGSLTVFGSRAGVKQAQAATAFAYQVHQAGQFELELPADLPPKFGGRFNSARFAGASITYPAAILDLPEDKQALDEQIKARPGFVTAQVAAEPKEEVPIYDLPIKTDKPLVGGSPTSYACAYVRQPGVPGLVELCAKDQGDWGNLIRVVAPESDTPGAFDVTVTYTGRDVFENARSKVAEQLAGARAAGILARVIRK